MKWYQMWQGGQWRGWLYTTPEVWKFLAGGFEPITFPTDAPPDQWFAVSVQRVSPLGQMPPSSFAGWFWGRQGDALALSSGWKRADAWPIFAPWSA